MDALKDLKPGPSKLAQFLALSGAPPPTAPPAADENDENEAAAVDPAPRQEAERARAADPPRAGLVARLSKRLSGSRRRSSGRSAAANSVASAEEGVHRAPAASAGSSTSRAGLVGFLSKRWSNERRADRDAVHTSSGKAAAAGASAAPAPTGLVRRMSRAWSGEAPLVNGRSASRSISRSISRSVSRSPRGSGSGSGDDEEEAGCARPPALAAPPGLVRRLSRAWSGEVPLGAAGDDFDAERGRESPQPRASPGLQATGVQRGMVRRLSQQWASGALRRAVAASGDFPSDLDLADGSGDDADLRKSQHRSSQRRTSGKRGGSREAVDDAQAQAEPEAEPTQAPAAADGRAPPIAPPRRARKSISDLVTLFSAPGAASALSARAAPERPSLTRLQQRTLERRKHQSGAAGKPLRLPPNVTPLEEFKLMLGPRRRRRGTNEPSDAGSDDDGDNDGEDEDADDGGALDAASRSRRSGDGGSGGDDLDDGPLADESDAHQQQEQQDQGGKRRSLFKAKLDRIRSMNASPSCLVCDKVVYRMEKLADSRDRPFHYYCLKCEDCPKSLVGQVVHVCEEPGRSGNRMVLCATHWHLRQQGQGERVKGWAPDTSHVNDGGRYANDPAAARKAVARTLGRSMGRKPLCSRCGGEILLSDEKNLVVSGMERLHLTCPDPDSIRHTPRHFVLAAQDRVPVMFAADARGRKGHSFLFRLESAEHKAQALELHRLEPVRLRYVPETDARTAAVKQVRCDNQHFAVYDRRRQFSEDKHPVTGKQGFTRFDAEAGLVLAQLYRLEAGVVHGLSAAFGYSYDAHSGEATVEALSLELTFEVVDVRDFTGAEQEIAQVRARSLKLHEAEVKQQKQQQGRRQGAGDDGDGDDDGLAPRALGRKKKHRFSLRLEDDFCERMRSAVGARV